MCIEQFFPEEIPVLGGAPQPAHPETGDVGQCERNHKCGKSPPESSDAGENGAPEGSLGAAHRYTEGQNVDDAQSETDAEVDRTAELRVFDASFCDAVCGNEGNWVASQAEQCAPTEWGH